MRILIIDDDEQVVRLARFALARGGATEVATATSGTEGLRIAAEAQFDAVLLDVMMPDLDGPSVLAALREKPATSSLPVIYLSAKDRPEEIASLMQTGARGVIRKPFDPSRLAIEIRARLDQQEPKPLAIAVPEALRDDFLVAAAGRLQTLERSLDVLAREPGRREHLRVVTSELHRLAGASASYGFTAMSEIARGGEEESNALAADTAPPTPQALHRLRERVHAMREQVTAAGAESARTGERRRRTVRILCIDSAPDTQAALRPLTADRAFAITFAEDASALAAPLPDVLIAGAGGHVDARLQVVERMRAMPHGNRAAVLLSVSRRITGAEAREAEVLGIDGFIDPRDTEQFAGSVRALAERKFGAEPRVLCIGVERYASSFASVIESAGYHVRIADDAEDLEADLETFDPDLILAGVDEQPAPALQVARCVRMLAPAALCPVVFIAWSDVADLELHAHRAGAAEVLRVPLSRALLLSALENHAVTARACRNAIRHDPLTGCLREPYFRERVRRLAGGGGTATVAALSVDPPDAITIVALADLLRMRLRDSDEIARAGEHLLVALEGVDEPTATAVLDRLRSEFATGARSFRITIPGA